MPGSLIPTWVKKHAEQALTPGRMTPARYRFSAAVTDNANHITPNMVLRPQIRTTSECRTYWALLARRPMRCRDILSRQGESVHSVPHRSPRTCRIRPECASLLVRRRRSVDVLMTDRRREADSPVCRDKTRLSQPTGQTVHLCYRKLR